MFSSGSCWENDDEEIVEGIIAFHVHVNQRNVSEKSFNTSFSKLINLSKEPVLKTRF